MEKIVQSQTNLVVAMGKKLYQYSITPKYIENMDRYIVFVWFVNMYSAYSNKIVNNDCARTTMTCNDCEMTCNDSAMT